MQSRLQQIKIGGEVAKMLVTPSLFSIARKKGINANIGAGASSIDVNDAFVRIMYCAYLNFIEVEKMDNPEYPDPVFKMMDFVVWAADNQTEASRMVEVIFELITGKSIKKTNSEAPEEEKKKNKKRSILSGIGKR